MSKSIKLYILFILRLQFIIVDTIQILILPLTLSQVQRPALKHHQHRKLCCSSHIYQTEHLAKQNTNFNLILSACTSFLSPCMSYYLLLLGNLFHLAIQKNLNHATLQVYARNINTAMTKVFFLILHSLNRLKLLTSYWQNN